MRGTPRQLKVSPLDRLHLRSPLSPSLGKALWPEEPERTSFLGFWIEFWG